MRAQTLHQPSTLVQWIAAQQSSHPDELWVDGVEDYIAHAKSLKSQFKDVIEAQKPGPAVDRAEEKQQQQQPVSDPLPAWR